MLIDWTALWMFVLSAVAAGGGWYLRTMREDLRELEHCVQKLSQKMSGETVRTEISGERLKRIEDKLDAIAAELARKVDRDDLRDIWPQSHSVAR